MNQPGPAMPQRDTYNRPINYLRVSVTDRCNLRCIYCMPPEGVPWRPHADILTFEEIETVVRAAAGLGISRVRLTGGEPLVRPGIVDLVGMLARIPGVDDLSMTTNGVTLARHAAALAGAGLQRVNVSLDTLRADRFRRITRSSAEVADVLAGIEAAREAGLEPVKVNVVVVRGTNDDEVVEFARRTLDDEGWHVRFIELMPVGGGGAAVDGWHERAVTAHEVRAAIEGALGRLEAGRAARGNGPARTCRLPGARGTVGFITPLSEHFCTSCNRLRLTSDGHLRPCLLSDEEIDLRPALRAGAGAERVEDLIRQAAARKPAGHHLDECRAPEGRAMSQIGG